MVFIRCVYQSGSVIPEYEVFGLCIKSLVFNCIMLNKIQSKKKKKK